MKTISRILIVLLIVGVPLAALSNPGEGREHGRMMKGLDLTDEQQAQVQQLRLEHQKEMMTLNDEMHSLRTQMKLLTTEDKPSTSEIETLAGKIGTAARSIALAKANHRLDVRKLLTDEQKVKFDIMTLHRGDRRGHRGLDRPAPPAPPGYHQEGPGENMKHRSAR